MFLSSLTSLLVPGDCTKPLCLITQNNFGSLGQWKHLKQLFFHTPKIYKLPKTQTMSPAWLHAPLGGWPGRVQHKERAGRGATRH